MELAAKGVGFHSDADEVVGLEHFKRLLFGQRHGGSAFDCSEWERGSESRARELIAVYNPARLQEVSMHYLWVALIGLIVGAIAKLLMPGKDPGGFIITMLLGIAGSFLATFIGRAVGWYKEGQAAGFIMSVIGAIILLAIYHMFRKSPAT
jgi:uncharacterized membrane protein YeaQ/YmgE (transglycosylase-associated protein family)